MRPLPSRSDLVRAAWEGSSINHVDDEHDEKLSALGQWSETAVRRFGTSATWAQSGGCLCEIWIPNGDMEIKVEHADKVEGFEESELERVEEEPRFKVAKHAWRDYKKAHGVSPYKGVDTASLRASCKGAYIGGGHTLREAAICRWMWWRACRLILGMTKERVENLTGKVGEKPLFATDAEEEDDSSDAQRLHDFHQVWVSVLWRSHERTIAARAKQKVYIASYVAARWSA
jgi:hypothetical protein